MAGSVQSTPGFNLQPSAEQVATSSNYITDFNFLNQYLPDTYEKEFERYGNRTVASFLRLVGAEMPTNSDLIKWAEQGRLHTKYADVVSAGAAGAAVGGGGIGAITHAAIHGASHSMSTVGGFLAKRTLRACPPRISINDALTISKIAFA